MAARDDIPLIPPAVSIQGLAPLPRPSDPPTKDDVDRARLFKSIVEASSESSRFGATADDVARTGAYYVCLRTKYEQGLGLGDTTLADVVLEVRRLIGDLRDAMDQRMNTQLELTGRLVQHMVSGGNEVAEYYRKQAIDTNRAASLRNHAGVEVPFLDGTLPSSKDLPAIRCAGDIARLHADQARAFAVGHGSGHHLGAVADIKNRLMVDLGFSVAVPD
ncbi:hypothetical protein V1525DRAFT_59875 [Lipomyces kononenkoae]|uniref:Uncharacterized protein n=1 Tax=Lipomyces kononenkoae TaxID=34357 RepID=A0ACC3SRY7_LIPKO